MTVITKTIVGLAGIVVATRVVCRMIALYGPKIRPHLDEDELAAFNALEIACTAWMSKQPISSD